MALKNISKSRYVAGLQCQKRLWLELYRYDLKDEVDEATQAIFDQGQEVGELAQLLYPDGVLIDDDYLHIPQAIKSTEKAVASGVSDIFEATAQTGRFMARADILHRVKKGSDEWDMIEVKSTLDAKPLHVTDLTFQKYVFEKAGYKIRNTYICHINRDYVRQGPLDIQLFFVLSDETSAVSLLIKSLPAQLQWLESIADLEKEPSFDIGPHCDKPYECPFKSQCWKDVPERSVFDLGGRAPFVWDLYKKGIKRLADIPATMKLSAPQRKQIEVEKSGQVYWKVSAIKTFLDGLEYPLSFLDFETVAMAIPPYDDTKAFQAIPTQFSLHVIQKPGGEIQHLEFLGDGLADPRLAFSQVLLKAIPSKGSILIYSPYEKTILKKTAEFLPKFKTPFNEIIQRCKDLAAPFQRRDVVHPDFVGGYSIKVVLPALVPGMNYNQLAIGDGNAAVRAYVQLMDSNVTETAKKRIRKDLLIYCGQDTLAMVKLVEVLRENVGV
ncbi:MAG TPA: DUF2779 domain-containing protein [bacterium]|jgi:hypothetical protein|nr:DUF2779 domain-containing protein [bacterium]